MSSVKQALLTKVFSALYGLVGYGLTYCIKFMPGMLEAAMIIGGVTSGPGIGVFTLGLLVPWVSSGAVTTAFITSLLVSCNRLWLGTGNVPLSFRVLMATGRMLLGVVWPTCVRYPTVPSR